MFVGTNLNVNRDAGNACFRFGAGVVGAILLLSRMAATTVDDANDADDAHDADDADDCRDGVDISDAGDEVSLEVLSGESSRGRIRRVENTFELPPEIEIQS